MQLWKTEEKRTKVICITLINRLVPTDVEMEKDPESDPNSDLSDNEEYAILTNIHIWHF